MRYLRSVNDLIDELADRVDNPTLDVEAVTLNLRFDLDDQLAALPEMAELFEDPDSIIPSSENINITEVQSLSAYAVDEKILVLASGKGTSEINSTRRSEKVVFQFGAWIEIDPNSRDVLSAEVYQINLE